MKSKLVEIPISFLLMALPLAAQFSNLATDDTGSRVWFSSPLQLRGSDTVPYGKIYSSDVQGNVTLVAHGEPYSLSNPEVSGDGSVLAYTGTPGCYILGAGCQYLDSLQATLSTSTGPMVQPGKFHLSRNGRYVMFENGLYFGPSDQIQLMDLSSMRDIPVPVGDLQSLAGGGRQVAANGSALASAQHALWLFGPEGSAQNLVNIEGPLSAALDDTADLVVYQNQAPNCIISMILPTPNPLPSTLVQSDQPCTLEALSADGSTVLFVRQAQAWIVNTQSKALQPITQDIAGIAEATLSGDGRIVWASTFGGRLLRIDRTSGVTQEVIPRTVFVDQPVNYALGLINPLFGAPGSLVHITGRGLAPASTSSSIPLDTTLNGIQVLMDGTPVPILSVSPTDIDIQIPTAGAIRAGDTFAEHVLTLSETQSPFGPSSLQLLVSPRYPTFWPHADGSVSIIHQDFHGPVSAHDVAQPDEILHLYVTGLGPVSPSIGDGQAAPLSPLTSLQVPLQVMWTTAPGTPNLGPVEVLFAGLAPTLVGVDQIDVRVPHNAPAQLSIFGAAFPVQP